MAFLSFLLPTGFTEILYLLCTVLLLASALFVWLRDRKATANRYFALTALALLGWLVTLFIFNRLRDPATTLLIGRLNFAAVAVAVFTAYRFVRSIADSGRDAQIPGKSIIQNRFLLSETILLTLITAFTPLIDREEIVAAASVGSTDRHITLYGPLFGLYVLHVLTYLGAAARIAFTARRQIGKATARDAAVRDQLMLIGGGMLLTGLVALITNAWLPYSQGNFRYIDVGPLSTILFLLAVAYAVWKHRLFNIRVFIRRTLVLGLALSFALAAYGALLVLATERFAGEGADSLTRFGVLVIAFSFDPVRRFLESHIDRLLFSPQKAVRRKVRS